VDPERTAEPPEEPKASDLVVERISPAPVPLAAPVAIAAPDVERDIFAVVTESRAAVVRGVESMNDEFASFARHSIDATADTAIQMLGAKTWADVAAVTTRFARTSYEQWLDSAAKVSELGVKLAYESSKPLISRFGKVWSEAGPGR
jgi:hypothetical protein